MAAIILPQLWTKQPQYPVGINRAHPYALEIAYANLLGPVVTNAINGGSGLSAGSFSYGVNTAGRALKFNGSTNYATTTLTANASQRTYIAVVQRNGDGGGALGRVFDKFTVTTTNDVLLNESGANCFQYQRAFSGGNGQWQFPRGAVGDVEIIGIVYDSSSTSNNPRVWKNGIAQTVTVLAAPSGTATNITDAYVIGNRASDFGRAWDGLISTFVVIDAIVDPATMSSLTVNPWRLFAPLPRRIFVGTTSSGVSGTSATTNANDTSAASGTTTVVGSLAKTNANDTSAASGATTVLGTLAKTNANDTSAASGTVGSGGSTGTVAYTNANDSVVASGKTTILGVLSQTNANDSVVASGWAGRITGTLARTNANDTVVANGNSGTATTSTTAPTEPNSIDWGALVAKTWGKDYVKPEWDYEFSNGRRFLEKKNPYA